MGVMFWQQDRRVAALPVVSVADAEGHAGQYFRVEGRLVTDPVYWRPKAPAAAETTMPEPVCWLTFRPAAMRCCLSSR
jgi:hypothetical protein